MAERIFVAIPCYRDEELQATLRSLFSEAVDPERIAVGVCLQIIPEIDAPIFRGLAKLTGVRVRSYDARTVPGLGWARQVAHSLRKDEEFVLQIDSHMRFHRGWDADLLRMLKNCPSKKPVLSTYPAAYIPEDPLECYTPVITQAQFFDNGMSFFEGESFELQEPTRTPFLAGGFAFAPAALFDDVPCDPHIGSSGEELGYSLRAFTHGWDFFAPHRCLIHRHYVREHAPRPSDDNADWREHEQLSMLRLHRLFGSPQELSPEVAIGLDGPYGLGAIRTRMEFEQFARIDFSELRWRSAPAANPEIDLAQRAQRVQPAQHAALQSEVQ